MAEENGIRNFDAALGTIFELVSVSKKQAKTYYFFPA
jgi:hypothetical protein